ncbi:MAG TPA: GNAT family N-acetyltransferase [Candidatus Limnocylindrales bacterium]
MTPPAVRRLVGADLGALSAEVDRAREAGEFRASSDADGAFFLKSVAVDPSLVGGAFDGDALVGFISPEFKLVVVRPDRRRQGIGRELVALGLTMERDRRRPDLLLGRLPHDAGAEAFLVATGFAPHSVLWDLELPSRQTVPDPVWPDHHVARSFESPDDVGSWVRLFNSAFADHATPLQLDESFIAAGLDDPAIDDADTLLVADATGELVGFCATAPQRRDGVVGDRGEIWTIGVRPDRQGRGLGRQLLRWGVGRLRDLNVQHIHLSVNGRNEHALRLYEDEGFVRIRTRERWARPVAAA